MKALAVFFCLLLSVQIFSQESLKVDFSGRGKRKKPFKITFFNDASPVGFLFVYKIPASRAYVFYSLYVGNEHRNNGHGKTFLNRACDYMKDFGAKKIYIQPGPFEIVNGFICGQDDAMKRGNMERLVRFYKRCGFKVAKKALRKIVFIAYRAMKIDEDADFLMVRLLP
jgi:GNAT superfamily N-acetyltransferase